MEERETETYTLDELSSMTGFDRRAIRSFIEQGLLRGANSMGRYAHYSSYHLTRLLAIKVLKENQGLSLAAIRTALVTMSEDEMSSLISRTSDFHLNLPVVNVGSQGQLSALAPWTVPPRAAGPAGGQADAANTSGFPTGSSHDLAGESEALDSSGEMERDLDDSAGGGMDFSKLNRKKPVQPPPLTALDYIKSLSSGSLSASNLNNLPPPLPDQSSQNLVRLDMQENMQERPEQNSEDERRSREQREQNLRDQSITGQTPIDLLLKELSRVHDQRHVRRQAKSEQWYRISITPDIELSVRGINSSEQLARLERVADHIREILLGGHYD